MGTGDGCERFDEFSSVERQWFAVRVVSDACRRRGKNPMNYLGTIFER
ncbi:hypothetical protein RESH_03732 [Rhodopirellula europaea SH398]|uniref:Uncharacterized protein n=1 Tax=Rhodopirellula europaea SH398 TaxID=1263868 RepID=M5S2J4_9BACT|nr:hypothetical protein RESH_03732 [Rhodopirellula europaea SH398]